MFFVCKLQGALRLVMNVLTISMTRAHISVIRLTHSKIYDCPVEKPAVISVEHYICLYSYLIVSIKK